ncbi:hypothetical protein BDAP_000112 [Binucleata daphniae]
MLFYYIFCSFVQLIIVHYKKSASEKANSNKPTKIFRLGESCKSAAEPVTVKKVDSFQDQSRVNILNEEVYRNIATKLADENNNNEQFYKKKSLLFANVNDELNQKYQCETAIQRLSRLEERKNATKMILHTQTLPPILEEPEVVPSGVVSSASEVVYSTPEVVSSTSSDYDNLSSVFQQQGVQTQKISSTAKNSKLIEQKLQFEITNMYDQTYNIIKIIEYVFIHYKKLLNCNSFTFYTMINDKLIFLNRKNEKIRIFKILDDNFAKNSYFTEQTFLSNEMEYNESVDDIVYTKKNNNVNERQENNNKYKSMDDAITDVVKMFIEQNENQKIITENRFCKDRNSLCWKLHFANSIKVEKVKSVKKNEEKECIEKDENDKKSESVETMQNAENVENRYKITIQIDHTETLMEQNFRVYTHLQAEDAMLVIHKSNLHQMQFLHKIQPDEIVKLKNNFVSNISLDRIKDNLGVHKLLFYRNDELKMINYASNILSSQFIFVPFILWIFESTKFYHIDTSRLVYTTQQLKQIFYDDLIRLSAENSEISCFLNKINRENKAVKNEIENNDMTNKKKENWLLKLFSKSQKPNKVDKNCFESYISFYDSLNAYRKSNNKTAEPECKFAQMLVDKFYHKFENYKCYNDIEKNTSIDILIKNEKSCVGSYNYNKVVISESKHISNVGSMTFTETHYNENKILCNDLYTVLDDLYMKFDDLLLKCKLAQIIITNKENHTKSYNEKIITLVKMFVYTRQKHKKVDLDSFEDCKLIAQIAILMSLCKQNNTNSKLKNICSKLGNLINFNCIKPVKNNESIHKEKLANINLYICYTSLRIYLKKNYGDFIGLCLFEHYKNTIESVCNLQCKK